MDPIVRIRVQLLGANDYPLAPFIDVNDPDTLAAIKGLIEAEGRHPRLTRADVPVIRAIVRVGVANLLRTLRLKPTRITDDGRLEQVR